VVGLHELIEDGALTKRRRDFKDGPPVLHKNKRMVWFPVVVDAAPSFNARTHRLVSDTVLEATLVRDTRTAVALTTEELRKHSDAEEEQKLGANAGRINIIIIKEIQARGDAVTAEFQTLIDRLSV